jgi:large subunit ribosomal protein L18
MSDPAQKKRNARVRRHRRVRKKVQGTADRPRLAVFRSNKHISAQVIDDATGRTLAAASSLEADLRSRGGNIDGAKQVGELLAARAKEAGVAKVVFDRGGFQYHGRVAALADAARTSGLEF